MTILHIPTATVRYHADGMLHEQRIILFTQTVVYHKPIKHERYRVENNITTNLLRRRELGREQTELSIVVRDDRLFDTVRQNESQPTISYKHTYTPILFVRSERQLIVTVASNIAQFL